MTTFLASELTSAFYDKLEVKCATTRTDETGKKPFTVYILMVKLGELGGWVVERRFSEFSLLRDRLLRLKKNLPSLPSKTIMRSLSQELVENRREGLHFWLQDLLKIPVVVSSPLFTSFIRLEEHAAQEVLSQHIPQKIKVSSTHTAPGVFFDHYSHKRENLVCVRYIAYALELELVRWVTGGATPSGYPPGW